MVPCNINALCTCVFWLHCTAHITRPVRNSTSRVPRFCVVCHLKKEKLSAQNNAFFLKRKEAVCFTRADLTCVFVSQNPYCVLSEAGSSFKIIVPWKIKSWIEAWPPCRVAFYYAQLSGLSLQYSLAAYIVAVLEGKGGEISSLNF